MLATFLKTYLNLKVLQPNGDKPDISIGRKQFRFSEIVFFVWNICKIVGENVGKVILLRDLTKPSNKNFTTYHMSSDVV